MRTGDSGSLAAPALPFPALSAASVGPAARAPQRAAARCSLPAQYADRSQCSACKAPAPPRRGHSATQQPDSHPHDSVHWCNTGRAPVRPAPGGATGGQRAWPDGALCTSETGSRCVEQV